MLWVTTLRFTRVRNLPKIMKRREAEERMYILSLFLKFNLEISPELKLISL